MGGGKGRGLWCRRTCGNSLVEQGEVFRLDSLCELLGYDTLHVRLTSNLSAKASISGM